MCPTCPQLAHFRWVPAGLEGPAAAAGDVGESGRSAAPSSCIPFCLSRAILRSLFRSSRLSSASNLQTIITNACKYGVDVTFVCYADFDLGPRL